MPPANATTVSDPSAFYQSSYRWIIMALAASAFLMAFVSRFAWPPLMPKMMEVMNIDRTEGLAYMTAFYIGYIATQIPGGALADRLGPRLVLAMALLLQGLGTLGLGFTENYQAGFALRIVCGLGGGCVYSSCLKALVTWFSPAQRGLPIAIVMSAPTLGVAGANYLLPALEASFGWSQAFIWVGVLVAFIGVLIGFLMKDGPAPSRWPAEELFCRLKICFRKPQHSAHFPDRLFQLVGADQLFQRQ